MGVKQVIVMRKDLNMRKGKMVAQGAHASVQAIVGQGHIGYSDMGSPVECLAVELTPAMGEWMRGNYKKVCVGVNSEEELCALVHGAEALGLPHALITDCGLTEFGGVPTLTCCAIGPAEDELVDMITGGLSLL